MLEAGASALLDLVDHLAHRAWIAGGEVTVVPLSDRDAKAARKRIEADAEARATAQAEALAALPAARGTLAQDHALLPPAGEDPRSRG